MEINKIKRREIKGKVLLLVSRPLAYLQQILVSKLSCCRLCACKQVAESLSLSARIYLR